MRTDRCNSLTIAAEDVRWPFRAVKVEGICSEVVNLYAQFTHLFYRHCAAFQSPSKTTRFGSPSLPLLEAPEADCSKKQLNLKSAYNTQTSHRESGMLFTLSVVHSSLRGCKTLVMELYLCQPIKSRFVGYTP